MKRLVPTFLLALSLQAAALAGTPPPAPGKYRHWDNRVDGLEVVQTFHLKDYGMVEVLPPDVSLIKIPTDNTHDAVRQNLADSAKLIAEELDGRFPNRMKIKAEPLLGGMAPVERSMTLAVRFLDLDPGSRSKRGLSFGNSGKASVLLEGTFTDVATKKPLLRFLVHNTDGSHGDYEHVLQENLEHAVDQIAGALKAFYP